jgi:hypothetical protein
MNYLLTALALAGICGYGLYVTIVEAPEFSGIPAFILGVGLGHIYTKLKPNGAKV